MAITARDEVHQIVDTLLEPELDALRRLLREARGASVMKGTTGPATPASLITLLSDLESAPWLMLIDPDTVEVTNIDRLADDIAGIVGQEGRIVLAQVKHAAAPGPRPLTGADLQPVDFWPEDEDLDEFEATIRRWRDQDAGRPLPGEDACA